MKTLALILVFAAVAAAQKPHKGGKHKPAYIAASPGGHHGGIVGVAPQAYRSAAPQAYRSAAPQAYRSAAPQAYQAAAPQSHHGGFDGSSNYASGVSKPVAKHPLLLSDTRTLNSDGTINFNYQADNGLHQGETVDSDGTRRGFYSYPGADGKLITVKYSAGKNGFVAEGDHLPTQPQSAPYSAKHDSDIYNPKQGSNRGHGGGSGHYSAASPVRGGSGHYSAASPIGGGSRHYSSASPIGGGSGHYSGGGGGAYRPSGQGAGAAQYSHSSGGAGSNVFANFPDFSSQSGSANHGGAPSYSSVSGAGRYPGASGNQGAGAGHYSSGHSGGSSSFGGLQGHGSSSLGASRLPDVSNIGSSYGGPMFTANNPYQPHTNGPVNAGFDLGNGGHFSINFAPGAGQEYNPGSISGDYSGQGAGAGGAGHGSQGRY